MSQISAHPLAKYKVAKQQLTLLTKKDEVKEFRDRAAAMEVYAYKAKDAELITLAIEIKCQAERRIGELMEDDRKAGKLAKGQLYRGVSKTPRGDTPTLEGQGIDKNLAKRSRTAFRMSDEDFEADLHEKQELAAASALSKKDVISKARDKRNAEKKKQRAEKERGLADKILALPDKKYGVIYADPEWKWETYSERGLDITSPENHYPTSSIDAIKARDVPAISAGDCILFMWATSPLLPRQLEVMASWGFEYKTSMVWVKDRPGTGYWYRGQHEFLLIGTRGNVPAPAAGENWPSVVHAKKGRHSEKPAEFYEMIEQYFPNLPKIELNARAKRNGWDTWGNEAVAA